MAKTGTLKFRTAYNPKYLDFGRRYVAGNWEHQVPPVSFETQSKVTTRGQKRKREETPHADRSTRSWRVSLRFLEGL